MPGMAFRMMKATEAMRVIWAYLGSAYPGRITYITGVALIAYAISKVRRQNESRRHYLQKSPNIIIIMVFIFSTVHVHSNEGSFRGYALRAFILKI